MKIVIVGAGKVGYFLAKRLCQGKHTVSVVDKEKAICEDIAKELEVLVINGDGCDPAILEEAGRLASADLVAIDAPGDRIGARFADGKVTAAPGFKEAYHRWRAGGWNGISAPEKFGSLFHVHKATLPQLSCFAKTPRRGTWLLSKRNP